MDSRVTCSTSLPDASAISASAATALATTIGFESPSRDCDEQISVLCELHTQTSRGVTSCLTSCLAHTRCD